MAKLVVYYSRADENYFGGEYRYIEVGNTAKVAKIIADETGAYLFEIKQQVPYAKDYDTCIAQAKEDLRKKARPQIVDLLDNLDAYDEIYVGYPNYWGDMPMAVYTFLESYDWHGKKIYPFCTHEGSGLSNTPQKIASVCENAVVEKGLAIHGSKVDHCQQTVLNWLER